MSNDSSGIETSEPFRGKSTKQLYCRLLGSDEIPKSPEEMPSQVIIPPEGLGDFEEHF